MPDLIAARYDELGMWCPPPFAQIAFESQGHVLIVVDRADGPYTCTMAPGTSMEVFRAMIE